MSVLTLSDETRRARKDYRCALCDARIQRGDYHRAQSNVFEDRVYTWRDCRHCHSDGVIHWVDVWVGGADDGVNFEDASEWARDAAVWSKSGAERRAARSWLARFCGGEGE